MRPRYAILAALLLAAGCAGGAAQHALPAPMQALRTTKPAFALYVADATGVTAGAIAVFDDGQTDSGLITDGIYNPTDMLIDPGGRVYVLNHPPGNGESGFTVYSPRARSPSAFIEPPSTMYGEALAMSAASDLFMGDSKYIKGALSTVVIEYGHGGSQITWHLNVVGSQIRTMAFDEREGLLAIGYLQTSAQPRNGAVAFYKPGSGNAPVRTIVRGIAGPVSLAFDSKGLLYVANNLGGRGTVTVYDRQARVRTITQGIDGPRQLAFDAKDDLFVSNAPANLNSTIAAYAPGTASPRFTISVAKGVGAFAVGPDSNVYASEVDQAIHVYASATGRPIRTIRDNVANPVSLGFGAPF